MRKELLKYCDRMRSRNTESAVNRRARLREEKAFQRITTYLQRAQQRLDQEREVTRLYGVGTSWQYFESAVGWGANFGPRRGYID